MALTRRMVLSLAGAAASLPWLRRAAQAQAYPTRPVRLIVGFAPGGPTDVFARLLGQKLGETLGTQCLVENIVGGTGNVATGQAAKAPADGYALYYFLYAQYFQSTDDAYVGGDITVVAPKVPGFIVEVAVTDNQEVRAGDLLVKLAVQLPSTDAPRLDELAREMEPLYGGEDPRKDLEKGS